MATQKYLGDILTELGYKRLEFEDPATFKKYRTYRKDGVRVALQAGCRLGEHKGYAWVFHGDVDDLIVQALITDPAFRRKGKARAALADLTGAADRTGTTLDIEPVPIASERPDMSAKQLQAFYQSCGFEPKSAGKVLVREPKKVTEKGRRNQCA